MMNIKLLLILELTFSETIESKVKKKIIKKIMQNRK